MSIQRESIGKTPDDASVDLYVLTNAGGMRVKIMTYGATIVSVEAPDRRGTIENVTLSLDSLADYLKGHPCLGSTIGRYANRIARGRFSIGRRQYALAVNNGPNHLHGGLKGFDKVVWRAEPLETARSAGVAFSYLSPDGEEGYPGTLSVTVVYSLTDNDELRMEYSAVADATTVVNLTNHAYWNLANGGLGDVTGHELMLNADRYLTVDAGLIPSGELSPVAGTPLDFTRPKLIGSHIYLVGSGYDHCYVLNEKAGDRGLKLAARAVDPIGGRTMEVYTTEPAIQLYTANGLDGTLRAGGKSYWRHFGFCLEAQHYPDSPNHPHFPTTLLQPGEEYRQLTVHKFGVM